MKVTEVGVSVKLSKDYNTWEANYKAVLDSSDNPEHSIKMLFEFAKNDCEKQIANYEGEKTLLTSVK